MVRQEKLVQGYFNTTHTIDNHVVGRELCVVIADQNGNTRYNILLDKEQAAQLRFLLDNAIPNFDKPDES